MLFKEFLPLLNPQSRKIVIGICLNAIGGGMTLSLLLVYLHDLRGFTNSFGGLLLAYGSIISILASTPMGALVDRIGPRKVMIGGLIINSAAAFSLSEVQTHLQAILDHLEHMEDLLLQSPLSRQEGHQQHRLRQLASLRHILQHSFATR